MSSNLILEKVIIFTNRCILTFLTLSNYSGLFYSLFWVELKRSVWVKGLRIRFYTSISPTIGLFCHVKRINETQNDWVSKKKAKIFIWNKFSKPCIENHRIPRVHWHQSFRIKFTPTLILFNIYSLSFKKK